MGYDNNINRLVPTTMQATLTTVEANSEIWVVGQMAFASHSSSHFYIDYWFSVNGGSMTSVSRTLFSNADGINSMHPPSGAGTQSSGRLRRSSGGTQGSLRG